METEMVIPVPPMDFNFDSNCSSPYITAPSSPQHFGNFFFSAPTSPTRATAFFHDLPRHSSGSASSVPFSWEEQPGLPKSKPKPKPTNQNDASEDFEFDFSGNTDRTSLSAADELFDGGKIRPLKPPPRLQSGDGIISPAESNASSPRSKISQGKKIAEETFSPRHPKRDFDSDFNPSAAEMEETRKRENLNQQNRGRERVSSFSHPARNSSRKTSRSLSPLRISDIICDSEENNSRTINKDVSSSASNSKSSTTVSSYASFLSSFSFTKGYRKWRLKDFLLFRSASEGRATDKDPLRKYTILSGKAREDEVRNMSFRSTESSGSVSRRRGQVSAHELHYTANRAASEEMKKKTFLPYRQGLLGCLGFDPGMHEITRGIGSLTRS